MSRLVEFYAGRATDTEGRRLAAILAWDDDDLEQVHDFIQWLFPLPEASRFNPDAPLLSAADVAAFRADAHLRANLEKSFARILTFLGLACAAAGKVVAGPNLAARARDVWAFPNHNWLRITRILRSLTLLGLEDRARAFFERLEDFYARHKYPIGADTFAYWKNAVESTD
jgi:hypothetical protein